ncbi:MAG: SulP family inorganic anion transporter [Elusimicrobia bacterium]|nr:SulP family inorganic anion transporter [Elusimicrobiota bacterium]
MSRESNIGDAWGGLAAMLVALPQALAFGVAAFAPLGPEHAAEGALAGLVGAAALGMTAAWFGGAPRLVSAPCAPAAAVLGGLAAVLAARYGAERAAALLMLTGLFSALLQIVYGAAGGGRLIKFIPYPVVTGYLSGVAVIMALGQLPHLLVLPAGMDLAAGLASPSSWSGPGLLVGLTAMLAMVLAPRLTKAVPSPVVALAAGAAAYWAAGYVHHELRSLTGNALVVGRLPGGLSGMWSALGARWSGLRGFTPEMFKAAVMPAATLSLLLSVDTLKTCVVVDTLTRSRHDSDRELRGQGLGNLVSALFGGTAGAGAMGVTLVNINAGGTTRLSGVLAGAFTLAALLAAGPLVAWVPVPALAGILLVVAWRMFDRKSLRLLRRRSTQLDFAVSAAVIVAAVSLDLIAAAGIGIGLAALLFLRDLSRGSVVRRKVRCDAVTSRQRRLPAEREALRRLGSAAVVCELQGSLFFGTTDQLLAELDADLKTCRFVILDLKRVQSVDFTAVHMLKQIEDRLHDRGGRLLLCQLPHSLPTGQDLESYFAEVGLVKPERFVTVFGELDAALEWVEDRLLSDAGLAAPVSAAALGLPDIDLFREFDSVQTNALRSILGELSVPAGAAVFHHGETGDEVYLIRKGRVRILLPLAGGQEHHVATFGRRDFFGEVAFLDRGVRTADAVALTPTELFALSRARFDDLSRSHPALGAMLFARLARALALRLRQADEELGHLHDA